MRSMLKSSYLLLFIGLLLGCGVNPAPAAQTQRYELHTSSENSVAVTIDLVIDENQHSSLVATYSPTDPTLHLYGKDMVKGGIDGAGRPTRLELVAGPVEANGKLQANAKTKDRYFNGFDQPFPLYPDGPVTLQLPITVLSSAAENNELQLSITYMACSDDGGCKPPVTDKQIAVVLPEAVQFN